MSTAHNSANMGDIAKVVLMPGDPLRAKRVADNYLENVVCFNQIRGMLGFTGTYKGHRISVMGSGMGNPSIGIYSYELFTQYGVEVIIRIGSTGAMQEHVKIHDVILVTGAYSNSSYAYVQSGDTDKVQKPTEELVVKLRDAAKVVGVPVIEGTVYSSDVFYYQPEVMEQRVSEAVNEYNAIGAEMESFSLFHNAKVLGKKAACLLTVSDSLITHEETTSEERQNTFTKMMQIALEAAISYE